ncbi:MAG: signal peptidase I [Pseudomonadota bacterium]|nr:signal peptidase I [Pseudomonadota bacterium]
MSVRPTPPEAEQPESMWELGRTIIMAMLIALVIRTFAFEPFNIPSSSMVPTLWVGDFLFVSKFSYGYGSEGTFWGLAPFGGRIFDRVPKRGDVIVFKLPKDNSTDYIKRLIGLPGDTVQMRNGLLYVNGTLVPRDRLSKPLPGPHNEEPQSSVTDYMEHLPQGPDHIIRKLFDEGGLNDTSVYTVPPRHYFFMGDNRDNSQDSRARNGGVGFVPEENLVGKAEFLFFSIDDNVHFWEVWKWPSAVRWDRLFTKIGA